MCVFGQICGFIGYFVFSKKDHAYLDGVYEEIIRDVYNNLNLDLFRFKKYCLCFNRRFIL